MLESDSWSPLPWSNVKSLSHSVYLCDSVKECTMPRGIGQKTLNYDIEWLFIVTCEDMFKIKNDKNNLQAVFNIVSASSRFWSVLLRKLHFV